MVEPYLPPELERMIFEIAFDRDDMKSNVHLLLIARRVREWIRPLIYSVFSRHGGYFGYGLAFPDFNRYTGLDIKNVGKFAKYLQLSVHTMDAHCDEIVHHWVEHCPNVENLVCWCRLDDPVATLAPLFEPSSKLRRLSIYIGDEDHATKLNSREFWFGLNAEALTHLELVVCPLNWPIDAFAAYSKLTHLSTYRPQGWTPKTIEAIFELCPSLQVFIIQYTINDGPQKESFTVDPKLELRVLFLDDGFLTPPHWYNGVKGRLDSWDVAERIVHARQHKYFNPSLDFQVPIPCPFKWDAHLTEEGKEWYASLPK